MADDNKEDLRRFIIKKKKEKKEATVPILRVCRRLLSASQTTVHQDVQPCWIWQECAQTSSGWYMCRISWKRSILLTTMIGSWLVAAYLVKTNSKF